MSSASTTTNSPVLPVAPTRVSVAHKLLSDLEATPAIFNMVVTALTTSTPFTGALSGLENFREDLVIAYTVFTKVAAFLKQMQALPPTPPTA